MRLTDRKHAKTAGISLILMALIAGYTYGYVHSTLIVANHPNVTFAHLKNAPSLYISGVIGWIVILITDLLVAWSLYKFFAKVNPRISLLSGLIRGVYSLILAFAIFQLIAAGQLIRAIEPNPEAIMNHLTLFEKYWSFGLILFGGHLFALGYLSIKSNNVPKWIGWLLYVAGFSYTFIHGAKAWTANSAEWISFVETILGLPMALAEIGLAIWLLWKGGKQKAQH